MSSFDVPNISFSGLSSGLDSNAIIASLISMQKIPIQLLESQKEGYQSKISKFDSLKNYLQALEDAAGDLKDVKDFNLYATTLSSEGVISASASTFATAGTYTISVSDLASFEQEASGNFADKNASFGTGTLEITVGGEVTQITIEEGQNTLDAIATAISNADIGVSASVISDGSSTPYRLVITGDETGEANTITVDASGLTGGDESLGAFTEIQSASDAHFTINGISMQRASNQVTDAMAGLTLTLLGTTDPGENVTLTVSRDNEKIKSKIQDFVDAYNDVVNFLNKQNSFDPDTKTGGVLLGESILMRIQSKLQSLVLPHGYDNSPGAPEIQMLSQMGINFENDGTLKVDTVELDDALQDNFSEVVQLFTDEDAGFGQVMDTYLSEFTKLEGLIDGQKNSLQDIIKNLDKQITKAEDRLDLYEASLVKKFAALESLMTGLQTQGSILSTDYGSSA